MKQVSNTHFPGLLRLLWLVCLLLCMLGVNSSTLAAENLVQGTSLTDNTRRPASGGALFVSHFHGLVAVAQNGASPSILVPKEGVELELPKGAVQMFQVTFSDSALIRFMPKSTSTVSGDIVLKGNSDHLDFKDRLEIEFHPKFMSVISAYYDPFTNTVHLVAGGEVVAIFTDFTNMVEGEPVVALQEGRAVLNYPEAFSVIFMDYPPLAPSDMVMTEDGMVKLNFQVAVQFGEKTDVVVEGGPVLTEAETLPDGTIKLSFGSTVSFGGEKAVVTDTAITSETESLGGELKLNFSNEVHFTGDSQQAVATDTGSSFGGEEALEGGTLTFNFSSAVGFEKNEAAEPKAPNVNAVAVLGSGATPGGTVGINDDNLKEGNIEITGETTTLNSVIDSAEVSIDGGVSWKTADGKEAFTYEFKAPEDKKSYNVRVRSTNEAGQVSGQFSFTLNFDPGAKAQPPAVADLDVNGTGVNSGGSVSFDDGDLIDEALIITGNAIANFSPVDKVEVSTDGGSYKTANGTDNFSYNVKPSSDKQTIKVSVRAKNEAGQTSTVVSFTIHYEKAPEPEAQPPEIAGVTVAGKDVASGETVTLTAEDAANGLIALEGTADTENSTISKVEISTNGGSTYNSAGGSSNWSYNFTASSAGGTYSVKVKATNAKSQATTYSFTVVYEGALPPVVTAAQVGDTGANEGATITIGSNVLEDGKIVITGTAEAQTGTITKVEVSTNNGASFVTADGEENWSYALTAPASKTTYNVQVKTTDSGARASAVYKFTLVYDPTAAAQPPEFTGVTVNDVTVDTGADADVAGADIDGASIPLAGTVSTEGSTVTKVEVSTNNGTSYATATGTDEWTYNLTKPAADTTYNMKLRATNAGGQTSTFTFRLVYTAPAVAQAPEFTEVTVNDVAVDEGGDAEAVGTEIDGTTIPLAGAATTENSTLTKIEISTNNGTSYVTVTGTDDWTYNLTKPATDTTYNMKVRATNAAGQTSTRSFRLVYTQGVQPPVMENLKVLSRVFSSADGANILTSELVNGKIKITGNATSVGGTITAVTVTVNGDSIPVSGVNPFTAEFTPVIEAAPTVELTTPTVENVKGEDFDGVKLMTPDEVTDGKITVKGSLGVDDAAQEYVIEVTAEDNVGQQTETEIATVNYFIPGTEGVSKVEVTFDGSSYAAATLTGNSFTYDKTPSSGAVYEIKVKVTTKAGAADPVELPDTPWSVEYSSKNWKTRLEEQFKAMVSAYTTQDSPTLLAAISDIFGSNVTSMGTKTQVEDNISDRFLCCDTGIQYSINSTVITPPYTEGSVYFRWNLPSSGGTYLNEQWIFERDAETNEYMLKNVVGNDSLLRFTDTVGSINITSNASALYANGQQTATITGTVRDSGGFIVRDGTRIDLTVDQGTINPQQAIVNNGQFTVTYTSDTSSGIADIVATDDATGTVSSNTVQITLKTVGTLTLAVAPNNLIANNADLATVTGTALDTAGVAVPNGTVINLTATLGTLGATSLTVTGGAFSTTYRAGTVGGTGVIIATGGDQGATANTTLTLTEEAPPLPPGFLPRLANRKDVLVDRFKKRRETEANLDVVVEDDENDLSWFEDDTF